MHEYYESSNFFYDYYEPESIPDKTNNNDIIYDSIYDEEEINIVKHIPPLSMFLNSNLKSIRILKYVSDYDIDDYGSIITLIFLDNFNKKLNVGDIPNTVINITFGNDYDCILDKYVIPESVINITFGNKFNKNITNSLPKYLQTLKFGDKFNIEINKDDIPNSVTTLIFGNDFNENINLPNSIINLTFGYNFNKEIKGKLPNFVKKLILGYEFKQFVDIGDIPDSVTHLVFNGPVHLSQRNFIDTGALPNNIIDLTLREYDSVYKTIPSSVRYLTINSLKITKPIPNFITHLTFGNNFNSPLELGSIPDSVTHLTFGNNFNKKISIGVLPESITHLTFGKRYKCPLEIGVIPESVTHLTFGDNFNSEIYKGILPINLTHLVLGKSYNRNLSMGSLPFGMVYIKFGKKYYGPKLYDGIIPETVTELEFGKNIKSIGEGVIPSPPLAGRLLALVGHLVPPRVIPNSVVKLTVYSLKDIVIPTSVTSLTILNNNEILKIGSIPNSIKELSFSDNFNKPIYKGVIPDGVISLNLGKNYNEYLDERYIPSSVKYLYYGDYLDEYFRTNLSEKNLLQEKYITINPKNKININDFKDMEEVFIESNFTVKIYNQIKDVMNIFFIFNDVFIINKFKFKLLTPDKYKLFYFILELYKDIQNLVNIKHKVLSGIIN